MWKECWQSFSTLAYAFNRLSFYYSCEYRTDCMYRCHKLSPKQYLLYTNNTTTFQFFPNFPKHQHPSHSHNISELRYTTGEGAVYSSYEFCKYYKANIIHEELQKHSCGQNRSCRSVNEQPGSIVRDFTSFQSMRAPLRSVREVGVKLSFCLELSLRRQMLHATNAIYAA